MGVWEEEVKYYVLLIENLEKPENYVIILYLFLNLASGPFSYICVAGICPLPLYSLILL